MARPDGDSAGRRFHQRWRRLFHSGARPDPTQARWISCSTCHVEGERDGRTWLLCYTGSVPPEATAARYTIHDKEVVSGG